MFAVIPWKHSILPTGHVDTTPQITVSMVFDLIDQAFGFHFSVHFILVCAQFVFVSARWNITSSLWQCDYHYSLFWFFFFFNLLSLTDLESVKIDTLLKHFDIDSLKV